LTVLYKCLWEKQLLLLCLLKHKFPRVAGNNQRTFWTTKPHLLNFLIDPSDKFQTPAPKTNSTVGQKKHWLKIYIWNFFFLSYFL